MNRYLYIISFIAILLTACKKPYTPNVTASNNNYLVVEGTINSAQDSTIINLSRTLNVLDAATSKPELGAQVTVESSNNNTYPIQEIGKGKYASSSLNLNSSYKYHLRIKTSDGKEYLSDYEAVKLNPPVDSVGFNVQANGINLYVNTHDPANNTRYYRWDYQETWQFHAKYESSLVTDGKELVPRTIAQQIYTCFANQTSSSIVIGSSAKLAKDVIYQNPLTQISSTSEKIETKYSILVRQYALTVDEYNFWQNLKKNTEQLGSIFDPQPSEISGNIHCVTDPSEPVVGYIGVTNVQEKRIFIVSDQLPHSWITTYPYQCTVDTALLCNPVSNPCENDVNLFLVPLNTTEFEISPISGPHGNLLGYLMADAECTDCTIRGKTQPPIFWK